MEKFVKNTGKIRELQKKNGQDSEGKKSEEISELRRLTPLPGQAEPKTEYSFELGTGDGGNEEKVGWSEREPGTIGGHACRGRIRQRSCHP